MIFNELLNAFFRFPLRCVGAEMDGGCSNTPPSSGGGDAPDSHGTHFSLDMTLRMMIICSRVFGITHKRSIDVSNSATVHRVVKVWREFTGQYVSYSRKKKHWGYIHLPTTLARVNAITRRCMSDRVKLF